MTGIASAAPTIAVLGVFACLIGGGRMIWAGKDRKRGALLVVMAGAE